MKKYDIFISYRRNGGWETAKHLYDLMTRDGYSVSFDIDTLREGLFDEQLLRRIDECTDFIVILDEHVFDRTIDNSCVRENDWLRIELAYAIEHDKNIIPIMLRGFNAFPDNLPSDIIKVKRYNAPKYDNFYFNDFYDLLLNKFIHSSPKSIIYLLTKRSLKKIYNKLALSIVIFIALIILILTCTNEESTYEIDEVKNVSVREMYNKGQKYYYGHSVAIDYKQAVSWFKKAAERGSIDAMCFLGVCYYTGQGVALDYKQAVSWFKKAAEKGDATAMYNLGVCYEKGQGVDLEYKQAVYWYQKVAEKGHARAIKNLAISYERGKGVTKSQSIADKLNKASEVAKAGDEDRAIEMVKDALK